MGQQKSIEISKQVMLYNSIKKGETKMSIKSNKIVSVEIDSDVSKSIAKANKTCADMASAVITATDDPKTVSVKTDKSVLKSVKKANKACADMASAAITATDK